MWTTSKLKSRCNDGSIDSGESRISQRGPQPPRGRQPTIWPFFPENCMKWRNFGRGGGRQGQPRRSSQWLRLYTIITHLQFAAFTIYTFSSGDKITNPTWLRTFLLKKLLFLATILRNSILLHKMQIFSSRTPRKNSEKLFCTSEWPANHWWNSCFFNMNASRPYS